MMKWKCTVCGHIHEGETPPHSCPVCGASSEKFIPYEAEKIDESLSTLKLDVTSADLLIVGSGAAALGAACTALGAGASVIILEKADKVGGTTMRSGGGYWIPCNSKQKAAGLEDDPQDALRYMARYSYPNEFDPDAKGYGLSKHQYELIESYINNAAKMVDHLESLGALHSIMEVNWTGKAQVDYMDHLPENKSIRGRSLYPLSAKGEQGMGAELIYQLEKYIKDKDGVIYTKHHVTEILIENDRAVGLIAKINGQKRRFEARKGIIFGTGGYSHDLELMSTFQRGPHYGGCAVPTNTGDFIKMAGSIGAAIGNMAGAFRAQSMIDVYLSNPEGSSNVFYIPGDSVILVNKYGKRIVDEKRNYNDRAMIHFAWDANCAEWSNMLTFLIFDERTAELWQGYPPYPVQNQKQPEYLLRANTFLDLAQEIKKRLEKLASHTGNFSLDSSFIANLQQTVEQFNSYARSGEDSDFHRGENAYDREWTTFPPTMPQAKWPEPGTKNYTMHPFSSEGPYYAIVLAAGTLDTNGGPVVNGNAQVLNWAGQPIVGLYGAGNCIASPTANVYWGAGSTIGPALTYGFIAANHAL